MKRLIQSMLCLSCWIFYSGLALGQEQILSFHSEIRIQTDASMLVTEIIRVRAEGQQIQRGIFRDFPTRYNDRFGNSFVVDFEMLTATRDGVLETWRVENIGNGVRIYLGNADVFLQAGEYSYAISYRTNRQVGYFEDHDELYWNVTGNGWAFQILQASATVSLPGNVAAADLTMEGYTGYFGASGQAYIASVQDGSASIQTTAMLPGGVGLTLAMTWPKGVIVEPTAIDRFSYLLVDNRGLLIALLTLLAAATYLYLAWSRVGRDPQSGTIFPHYTPPKGYSPASARYISKMSYDMQVFTAAVINLAVKGYLQITKEQKEYVLSKTFSKTPLAAGEQVIIDKLFSENEVLELKKENHEIVMGAIKGHRKALKRNYLNISVLGALTIAVVAIFAVIAGLHGLFAYLLKAPSVRGRVLMDKLEGFKLYLEVAEEDDLNLRHPPDKTPELFEQMLPY
ncbi:MAG: DUF2207 domain-containing protein, partial [Gammaproteobacteria bacterium]|nr:DUF2207 domain-containing protein [Gammaproteobacteria bacterium]